MSYNTINSYQIDNMSMNCTTILIPLSEYEKIKQENNELRKKLDEYVAVINLLQNLLVNKDKTIEELKKENIELKYRITELERKQETTNKELQETKIDLQNFKNSILYNKLIVGIQDYNAMDKLETQIVNNEELKNLREDRVSEYHYIKNDATQQEKNIKINMLVENISNAPKMVIDMFEDTYPNLLETLKPFLVKRIVEENAKITLKAQRWWIRF